MVLSGPSGAGKSTLIKKLFKDYENVFGFSVSREYLRVSGRVWGSGVWGRQPGARVRSCVRVPNSGPRARAAEPEISALRPLTRAAGKGRCLGRLEGFVS